VAGAGYGCGEIYTGARCRSVSETESIPFDELVVARSGRIDPQIQPLILCAAQSAEISSQEKLQTFSV
jgi:hypothetical protein